MLYNVLKQCSVFLTKVYDCLLFSLLDTLRWPPLILVSTKAEQLYQYAIQWVLGAFFIKSQFQHANLRARMITVLTWCCLPQKLSKLCLVPVLGPQSQNMVRRKELGKVALLSPEVKLDTRFLFRVVWKGKWHNQMCRKKSTNLLLVFGLWDGKKEPTHVAFYKKVEINPRAFQIVPLEFGGKSKVWW